MKTPAKAPAKKVPAPIKAVPVKVVSAPKYPGFVITSKIKINISPAGDKRYSLSIPIDPKFEEKESVVVIMHNPSQANKTVSDRTVNRVLKYVHGNPVFKNVGTVIILNLIPIYATAPSSLTISNLTLDPVNRQIIDDFTKKHKNVIIAWGDCQINRKAFKDAYKCLICQVLGILKKNGNKIWRVGDFTIEGNPRHPARSGWGSAKSPKSLLPY